MKTLQPILRHVGSAPLLKSAEHHLLNYLIDDDEPHPSVTNLIYHLSSQDMTLLETLAASSELVSKNELLVGSLLANAHAISTSPKSRGIIRRLAAKSGLSHYLTQNNTAQLDTLTESQRSALDQLHAMAALYFEQAGAPQAVKLRLNPLVVGPSGVGKTHLVETLGGKMGIPVMRVTVGDWIVAGARLEPCTLQVLAQKMDEHPRLILHIDEADKFQSREAWGISQQAEIFSVLDRKVGFTGSTSSPWARRHNHSLRNCVFIVGSGTWQSLWTQHVNRSFGFNTTEKSADEIAQVIRKAEVIPPELLNRFSEQFTLLSHYSEKDFQRIAALLKLPIDKFDVRAAASSGLNFRYVEAFLTNAAVTAQMIRLSRNREEPPSDSALTAF